MYRLLIVDNESVIVDGLVELFRGHRSVPLDVVAAYSSAEALQWLGRTKIDVVLTDIRMPGMDGLELQKRIAAQWPRCKVVFLSGHNDFQYVQEAIRNGGVDYLLKTEQDDNILRAVGKAVSALTREQETESLILKAREQLHKALPKLQSDFFARLIDGDVAFRRLREHFAELHIPLDPDLPVLPVIGKIDGWQKDFSHSDKSLLVYAVQNIANEYLRGGHRAALFSFESARHMPVWFVQPAAPDDGSPTAADEEEWRRLALFVHGTLEYVQDACKQALKQSVSFAAGRRARVWSDVPELTERLQRLLSFHFGERELLLTEDAEPAESSGYVAGGGGNAKHQLRKIEMLKALLENGDRFEFFKTYAELVEALSPAPEQSVTLEFYYAMSALFVSYLNRWALFPKIRDAQKLLHPVPSDALSWEQLSDFFRSVAEAIFHHKTAGLADKQTDLIERIDRHIEMNLANDLSLSAIAETVGHHPSYLSRLYKQITGRNLSDTMMETRLNKAKELLRHSPLKIHEISKAVGFVSEIYFYRFFKKTTGHTPQEFRDASKDQSGAGVRKDSAK